MKKTKNNNTIIFLAMFLGLLGLAGKADAAISTPAAISTSYSAGNDHYARGEKHVVNVGNTTVAIVSDGASERLFRSTDRSSWTEILYTPAVHSSSLLTGPDNYVYYFYADTANNRIRMRKFLADAVSIPVASTIYTNSGISTTSTGAYRSVSSTIDKDGRIFVFIHYGSPDSIYCLVSSDYGSNWNNYLVASPETDAYYGLTATTLSDGTVALAYDVWGTTDTNIWFTKSTDHGQTWSSAVLANNNMGNPAILAMPDDTLYVFGQSNNSANRGVIFNRSNDKGATWQNTVLVEATCEYGDPNPALGSDGSRIWLIYRSSQGITTGATCGDKSRQVVAYSDNGGTSWTVPWRYDQAERVGVHGHISYQPYYNYGGPIEWVWLQYTDSGAYRRTFYSYSSSDTKYSIDEEEAPEDTTAPNAPSGLSVS